MTARRFIVLSVGILGISLVVTSAWRSRTRAASAQPKETVRAARGNIAVIARFTGRVKPRSTVEVKSPVSGRLLRFLVPEGGTVRAGQPLAAVQPEQAQALIRSQAEIDVQLRQLAAIEAQREFSRTQRLYEQGIIAIADLQSAMDAHAAAQAQLQLARTQLRIVEQQAPPHGSERQAFQVVAPVPGTLLSLLVQPGEAILASTGTVVATGGTPIAKIADTSALLVRLHVSEVDVHRLRVGMPATIRPAWGGRTYTARVSRVALEGTVTENVVTFPVDLLLDAPAPLRPEMTVDVDLLVDERRGVLTLPLSAVAVTDRGAYVRMHDGTRRTVRLGVQNDQVVEITDGLREGEVARRDTLQEAVIGR
jgi:HlyD family secretion protein